MDKVAINKCEARYEARITYMQVAYATSGRTPQEAYRNLCDLAKADELPGAEVWYVQPVMEHNNG